MIDTILTNEPAIRLAAFILVFAVIALWELRSARRPTLINRFKRWPHNFMIVFCGSVLLRWTLPVAAVGASVIATKHQWGLLHWILLPDWLVIVLSILLLDMTVYWQHRLFHAHPLLWRLHRMHHTDLHYDVTTGFRFHPIEILLSMVIKIAVVISLGAPPIAVLLFEILLNAAAMFNHGNIKLSDRTDQWLRRILVTPDMHRVHHSIVRHETDSNFGFCLPWWDRLFKTYQDQPTAGHLDMTIGLSSFRAIDELRIDKLLTQPFRHERSDP